MIVVMKKTNRLKRLKLYIFAILLLCVIIPQSIQAHAKPLTVYLGGFSAGFTIDTKGAEVIGLSEVVTDSGIKSPAKDTDIRVHDIILSLGGLETDEYEDIESALKNCEGKALDLSLKRNDEIILKKITPAKDLSGKYKLGLLLRDKLTGIGTVTFIKDNLEFMALGHAVCGANEKPIEISGGELYACSIFGIEKGTRGHAGELRGMFLNDAKMGYIDHNLTVGITGRISEKFDLSKLGKIEVGDAHPGKASLITTIDGIIPEEFSISIAKVDNQKKDNRNYVIVVTDDKLLEVAGGIVQGMSGSPIIQDGKIVGAVTHVFVSDPTRGFGISIQKMLQN